MYVVVNACCCQKMHSFIPNISIAPFQFTITQGLPRLQHLYCVAVNTLKRKQTTASDRLAQGSYAAAGVGIEPATFGTQDTETTPKSPRLTLMSLRAG